MTHFVADTSERTTYCGQRRRRADAAHVYVPLEPTPPDACPRCVAATRPSPSLLAAAREVREILRGRGRPVKAPSERATEWLTVRLRQDDRQRLDAYLERTGQSLPDAVRQWIDSL